MATSTELTHNTNDPPDVLESVTVEHIHRSAWPLFAALTLAAGVGLGTAWLLLVAPLAATNRFVVAAAVPVGLGLLAIVSTLRYRETPQ